MAVKKVDPNYCLLIAIVATYCIHMYLDYEVMVANYQYHSTKICCMEANLKMVR